MKKTILFLPIMVLCFLATSCKNSVSEELAGGGEIEGEGTTKVVKLRFNEEQLSTSQGQDPMTRADGDAKTYYGINVYKQTDKGNTKFAYGLFDNTNDMNLLLEEYDKYTIECVEIRNAEDTVFHKANKFYYPFYRDNEPGELTNKFISSSTINNDEMTSGDFSINEQDTVEFPRVYTFYGELGNIDPSKSDEVTLDLRRAVFGIRFKVTPPKDGSVIIRYLNDYEINIKAGDEPYDHQSIYSFHRITKACAEGYNGYISPAVIWTYSTGKVVKEIIKVNLARNTITTVNISFSGASPTGITVNEENSSFDNQDSTYIIGNN